jgi:hypothetical protein
MPWQDSAVRQDRQDRLAQQDRRVLEAQQARWFAAPQVKSAPPAQPVLRDKWARQVFEAPAQTAMPVPQAPPDPLVQSAPPAQPVNAARCLSAPQDQPVVQARPVNVAKSDRPAQQAPPHPALPVLRESPARPAHAA